MKKRNCIMTGFSAESKIQVSNDPHSWAKHVPISEQYLEFKKVYPNPRFLDQIEIKAASVFYESEVKRLTSHTEANLILVRLLAIHEQVKELMEGFKAEEQRLKFEGMDVKTDQAVHGLIKNIDFKVEV